MYTICCFFQAFLASASLWWWPALFSTFASGIIWNDCRQLWVFSVGTITTVAPHCCQFRHWNNVGCSISPLTGQLLAWQSQLNGTLFIDFCKKIRILKVDFYLSYSALWTTSLTVYLGGFISIQCYLIYIAFFMQNASLVSRLIFFYGLAEVFFNFC